jgi:pimeloyl-ACP methyl ester carboxylesterase
LFEKVVPELSKRFPVYALDYPGHGYSDIPNARYDSAFFTEAVEGFLDKLDLRHSTYRQDFEVPWPSLILIISASP